jgi:hypothetical protein
VIPVPDLGMPAGSVPYIPDKRRTGDVPRGDGFQAGLGPGAIQFLDVTLRWCRIVGNAPQMLTIPALEARFESLFAYPRQSGWHSLCTGRGLSAASIKSTPETPKPMTVTFDFTPTHDFFDRKGFAALPSCLDSH